MFCGGLRQRVVLWDVRTTWSVGVFMMACYLECSDGVNYGGFDGVFHDMSFDGVFCGNDGVLDGMLVKGVC